MFEALRACGALARILPEVDALFGVPQPPAHHPEVDTGLHIMLVLDYAAARELPAAGALRRAHPRPRQGHHAAASSGPAISGTRRAASSWSRALPAAARAQRLPRAGGAGRAPPRRDPPGRGTAGPSTIVKLLEQTDALRRPERFEAAADACACDFHGRPGFESRPYAPAPLLRKALEAARAVDAGAIARRSVRARQRSRQRCTRRACTRSGSAGKLTSRSSRCRVDVPSRSYPMESPHEQVPVIAAA